jgi:hypothetical protein
MHVLERDGYVISNSLVFTTLRIAGVADKVLLAGTISCANDVEIYVTKYMDCRPSPRGFEVITTYYRYHARRPGRSDAPIVRYDPAHEGPHCHRYARDGSEAARFTLTLDEMPRLDEVIRDAAETARSWDAEE